MSKKLQQQLKRLYRDYRQPRLKKTQLLKFFASFMPEIVYRSTRLEGERVARARVSSIFSR